MKQKSVLAAGLAVAAMIASLTACGSEPAGSGEQSIRIGLPVDAISFNQSVVIHYLWMYAAYDSLMLMRDGLELEPNVATRWEYGEGNRELVIELRDDVVFSDGEPLDAEAVKANIEYNQEDDSAASLSPFYAAIEETEVTGAYSLRVRLSRPDAHLLAILAGMTLFSPAALEAPDSLVTSPAGSGPYLLDSTASSDAEYVFTRNPAYWNADAYPYDRIEMVLLPDLTARVNALKSGQIDFAPIDGETAAEAEASGLEISVSSAVWVGFIIGDRRGEIVPALADVRVRQAISMALDRVAFAESVDGGLGDPSNQRGVEGQDGYYLPDRASEYAYDLDGARELMAEAGYADGFDIDVPYSEGATGKYNPYLRQALEDLDIRANWIGIPPESAFTEFSSGKYGMLPFPAFFDDTAPIEEDGLWNGWRNWDDETAELMDVIGTGAPDEALDAQTRLSEKILDEAWFAVLTHIPAVIAYVPGVSAHANGRSLVPLINIRPTE